MRCDGMGGGFACIAWVAAVHVCVALDCVSALTTSSTSAPPWPASAPAPSRSASTARHRASSATSCPGRAFPPRAASSTAGPCDRKRREHWEKGAAWNWEWRIVCL
ncbi:hypothetical protein AGOR_G00221690 [Albula goreensis]|uniref:Secreted protein n=1 Tax=Albula goreensis TaxID=1534307 RepID=A0A8T3CJ34_9TELE|nr:hypothetical protein AGOR_G00221690 [Albula goreensis]